MDIRNTQIYQNHLNEDRIRFVRDRFPSGLKALMLKNITTVRLKFLSQLLSKKLKKRTRPFLICFYWRQKFVQHFDCNNFTSSNSDALNAFHKMAYFYFGF